jgi:Cu(I)/Ag(I) efflux system membrane fusion protein
MLNISVIMILLLTASLFSQQSDSYMKAKEMPTADTKEGEQLGEEVPIEFRDQLYKALNIYFELKDALVKADSKKATEKAADLKNALERIDSDLLDVKDQSNWDKSLATLLNSVENLASKVEIEDQRASFLKISESLIVAVQNYGPFDVAVYVQHCPMAFNSSGGHWLSNSEKILNPYFGSMMLHCGRVIEKIDD